MQIDHHRQVECDMVKVKCSKCDLIDTRGAIRSGSHDCITLLKSAYEQLTERGISEKGDPPSTSRLRSGDQRPRAYDDYNNKQNQKSGETNMVLKQMDSMKKNLQGLETLVNEDIFRMLDNMSLCVTQKDNEVQ